MSSPTLRKAKVSPSRVLLAFVAFNSALLSACSGGGSATSDMASADTISATTKAAAPVTIQSGLRALGHDLCIQSGTTVASAVVQTYCGKSDETFVFMQQADGTYLIAAQANKAVCFDAAASGGAVSLSSCATTPSQTWSGVANSDGSYSFVNKAVGGCLYAPNDFSPPTQVPACNSAVKNQSFRVSSGLVATSAGATTPTTTTTPPVTTTPVSTTPVTTPPVTTTPVTTTPVTTTPTSTVLPASGAGGLTTLRSAGNDSCLNVSGLGSGSALDQTFCGNVNESFKFTQQSDGSYLISPQAASGMCLDAGTGIGAVTLNACSGSSAQRWAASVNSAGKFSFASQSAGSCLYVHPDWTAAITLTGCDSSANYQKFGLTTAVAASSTPPAATTPVVTPPVTPPVTTTPVTTTPPVTTPPVTTTPVTTPPVTTPPVSTPMVAAQSANDFLNSLGVNTHIAQGYDYNTYVDPLKYLGVRNIRDQNHPDASYISLYQKTGVRVSLQNYFDLNSLIASAKVLASAGALMAVEGTNEPNNFTGTYNGEATGGSATWLPIAKYQRDIYNSVKGDPLLKNYPVFTVSETGAETDNVGLQWLTIPSGAGTLMPDGTKFADYANVHNYVANNQNNYVDNQAWQAADPTLNSYWDGLYGNHGTTWRNKFAGYSTSQLASLPRVTTETGWDSVYNQGGETVQGVVLVSTYLSQFKRGWKYTFIYELRDNEGGDGHQGLFREDSSPKPSAAYIHNLTTILADTNTLSPGQLGYSIGNQTSTVHDLLLQKSNGTYFLVVWNERVSGTDNVTVNLNSVHSTAKVYDVTVGPTPTQTLSNVSSVSLTLGNRPMVIELP